MAIKNKPAKKGKPTKEVEFANIETSEEIPQELNNNSNRSKILIGLIVILVISLLYYFRGVYIAAMVNGEPISRLSIINQLEKQSGKQVLEGEITKTLILQEARKKKINVDKKEIDDEIKTIEKSQEEQGQSLDQALAVRGMTREQLIEQIRIQKTVEKLLEKDKIKASKGEIDGYIAQNKDTLLQNVKPEDINKIAEQQIVQQKLSEKFNTWIENLQKDAKINYFVGY